MTLQSGHQVLTYTLLDNILGGLKPIEVPPMHPTANALLHEHQDNIAKRYCSGNSYITNQGLSTHMGSHQSRLSMSIPKLYPKFQSHVYSEWATTNAAFGNGIPQCPFPGYIAVFSNDWEVQRHLEVERGNPTHQSCTLKGFTTTGVSCTMQIHKVEEEFRLL